MADTTIALLEGLGATVVAADSADAALRQDMTAVDVVLSDVMMPGTMDGIGLARWLAEHHPGLPVVLCSGYLIEPQRLQSLRADFVRKPYRIGELVDTVRRALARSADPAPTA